VAANVPEKTPDGRPYRAYRQEDTLWIPDPPQLGDRVYRDGEVYGTYYGPPGSRPGDGSGAYVLLSGRLEGLDDGTT
jgi:hypothetical protein